MGNPKRRQRILGRDGFKHALRHQFRGNSAEECGHRFALSRRLLRTGLHRNWALGSGIRLQSRGRPSFHRLGRNCGRPIQPRGSRSRGNKPNHRQQQQQQAPTNHNLPDRLRHLTAGFGQTWGAQQHGTCRHATRVKPWGFGDFTPVLKRGSISPHAVHQISISVEITRKTDSVGFFETRFHPSQKLTELSTTYPRVVLTKQAQTSSPTQRTDVVQGGVQRARNDGVFQIAQIAKDQSSALSWGQTVHRQGGIW